MLTSESHNDEIHRFFRQHNRTLAIRTLNLVNKKYAYTLARLIQRGEELPKIFGTYNVDDITLYGSPNGIRQIRGCFTYHSISPFLIMKDLREQTRIMVTNFEPHAIIYKTHAISRYKERMELDADMDFVEVCKNMFLSGCTGPSIIVDSGEIYGTDLNCRTAKMICADGAFLGYMSGITEVIYVDTFLSHNELREDQQYLDVNKNPILQKKKESWEKIRKGTHDTECYESGSHNNDQISIEGGKMKILSEEEIKAKEKRFEKKIEENPNFFEDQLEPNRQKAINRLKRKGFK